MVVINNGLYSMTGGQIAPTYVGDAAEDDFNPKDLSVLAVDDDPVALEHAQLVLGKIGITCETAASGAEALEKVRLRHARREDYDLLLVDWKMPEMDGVTAWRPPGKSAPWWGMSCRSSS